MATIELKQVEKKFGDVHAVQPMDLTIRDGEFVVLLGPSGCGKTTTLRMISGLEAVTGGRIYLNGNDVTWRPASERDIAFVFQFFALYPRMTVYQNIAFPLESRMRRSELTSGSRSRQNAGDRALTRSPAHSVGATNGASHWPDRWCASPCF
jgi:multiple sugar transport system ATP-binding protein